MKKVASNSALVIKGSCVMQRHIQNNYSSFTTDLLSAVAPFPAQV